MIILFTSQDLGVVACVDSRVGTYAEYAPSAHHLPPSQISKCFEYTGHLCSTFLLGIKKSKKLFTLNY